MTGGAEEWPGRVESALRIMLPTGVAVCAVSISCRGGESPFEEERRQIAGAGESRRREYFAARSAARQALAQLGAPESSLLKTGDGDIQWPDGFLGNITHTADCAAAVAAPAGRLSALGIDLEDARRMTLPVALRILAPEELRWIEEQPQEPLELAALFFSGKEAFYKALHPHTKKALGFRQVRLDTRREAGGDWSFEPHVLSAGIPTESYRGRLRFVSPYSIAACWRCC